MYLLVIGGPLMGAVIVGILGRYIGGKGINIVILLGTLIGVIVAILQGYEVLLCGATTYISIGEWVKIGEVEVYWGIQLDKISSIMVLVVLPVSMVIQGYSIGYMGGDKHRGRFMLYMGLFTALMVILVTADNYLQLFIGWEGVGLCSYLLIGYWGTRVMAIKAAIKAIIVNRIGDLGLLLGILGIYKATGGISYTVVDGVLWGSSREGLLCILLLIGAMGKSAQIGLFIWLVDAMEGPTPVSSLIHAATMVTAGVYLLIRAQGLYINNKGIMVVVGVIGALTAILGATSAIGQNDIKKIIAYSTSSQLGYMVAATGVGAYWGSLYHLVNHAYYKGLLFMGAGAVIHAMGEEQDIRKYGGLVRGLPLTYILMLIGSVALVGVPYTAGYYSKERIIEETAMVNSIIIVNWLLMGGAVITAIYSVRLLIYTFIGASNGNKYIVRGVREGEKTMLITMGILGVGSITIGYMGKELLLGESNIVVIGVWEKSLPIIGSILGAVTGGVLYKWGELWGKGGKRLQGVYTLLQGGWHYTSIINRWVVKSIWSIGYKGIYKGVDKGLLERVGPGGIKDIVIRVAGEVSNIQGGKVYNYIVIMGIYLAMGIWGIIYEW